MQSVDLRHTYSHLRFGSDSDLRAWQRECEQAQARMVAPYEVAPRCIVETKRGVLSAGEPVAADDLMEVRGRDGHPVAPWKRFQELVQSGAILERVG